METELMVAGVGASVVIGIIVEALKAAFLPSAYAPVTAVALGVIFGIFAIGGMAGIFLGILSAGLASGLYSWQQKVREVTK